MTFASIVYKVIGAWLKLLVSDVPSWSIFPRIYKSVFTFYEILTTHDSDLLLLNNKDWKGDIIAATATADMTCYTSDPQQRTQSER